MDVTKVIARISSMTRQERASLRSNAVRWREGSDASRRDAGEAVIAAIDAQELKEDAERVERVSGMSVSDRIVDAFNRVPLTDMERDVIQVLLDNPGLNSTELSKKAMANNYGTYRKDLACWVMELKYQQYCMRPHRLDIVEEGGKERLYIVVGGFEGTTREDCHACSGRMGLLLYEKSGNQFKLIAKNNLVEKVGSWGAIPPEEDFSLRKIGSNGSYAWFMTAGFMGQGVITGSTQVYADVGGSIVEVGHVPSYYSDEGAGYCDTDRSCSNYTFQIITQPDPRTEQFYPILLRGEGLRKGSPFNDVLSFKYNKSKLTYQPNVTLPDEFSFIPASQGTEVERQENQKVITDRVSQSSAPVAGLHEIPLVGEAGTWKVPVLINGSLTLDFTVDSGASDTSIPADVVLTLIRTGTVREDDFLGTQTYVLADGTKVPSHTFLIRSLKVGDVEVRNAVGLVADVKGSLLLGQSFLKKVKRWSINNEKAVLEIEQ